MSDSLKDFGITRLDIKQVQIDVHQLLVTQAVTESTGRIETGVQAEFFAASKNTCGELNLHERLATGQGYAPFADLEYLGVLADDLHRLSDTEWLAVLFVPCVRIVAILAPQQTAGQKDDETQSWSINGAAELRRVDVTQKLFIAILGNRFDVTLVNVKVGGAQ
jgi:hypothetical protein